MQKQTRKADMINMNEHYNLINQVSLLMVTFTE